MHGAVPKNEIWGQRCAARAVLLLPFCPYGRMVTRARRALREAAGPRHRPSSPSRRLVSSRALEWRSGRRTDAARCGAAAACASGLGGRSHQSLPGTHSSAGKALARGRSTCRGRRGNGISRGVGPAVHPRAHVVTSAGSISRRMPRARPAVDSAARMTSPTRPPPPHAAMALCAGQAASRGAGQTCSRLAGGADLRLTPLAFPIWPSRWRARVAACLCLASASLAPLGTDRLAGRPSRVPAGRCE
jgi:hypothetical protein